MKKIVKISLLLNLVFSIHIASAQFFINPKEPSAPGQRKASITIDLKGLPVSEFKASIVYGTDSAAVKNAFNIAQRDPSRYFETPATLQSVSDGKAKASVIFPHGGNPATGTGKVFSKGTKVFYAWTRTNRPAGFTEDLTLNSAVNSFIMPRPLTIAYLGDSYASGEGAKGSGDWMHEPCHRSANSGGELAIRKLKQEEKEYEIDYINTTCSGARVLDFFAVAQRTKPGETTIKQGIQVDLVNNWLSSKNYDGVDILLADGGGNDVGFGNVVENGLLSFFDELRNNSQLREDVQRELNRLPETYSLFVNYLESKFSIGRIVWFNYPNPLTGNPLSGGRYDVNLCKQNIARTLNPKDCWGPLENNVENEDWRFVHDELLVKLNQKVSGAASTYGWDFVNVTNRALGKGICNCAGYFNTAGQSFFLQADFFGTMHPNISGFREIYRDPLYNQLKISIDKFYQGYNFDEQKRKIADALQRARAAASLRINATKISTFLTEQIQFQNNLKNIAKPIDPKMLEIKKF